MGKFKPKNALRRALCGLAAAVFLALSTLGAAAAGQRGGTGLSGASDTTQTPDVVSVHYSGVASVELDKKGNYVRIESHLSEQFLTEHKKDTVYLFALPYGAQSLAGLRPIVSFRATGRYVYKTELRRGSLSGIYDGYQLALASGDGYDPIGTVRYIPDLTPAAARTYDYPAVRSLKGLEVTNLGDALSLNLSHAVVAADISTLLLARGGADVTDFDFNGRTVHVSTSALSSLDDSVRALSGQGARVYLRIMPGEAYDSAAGLCSLMSRRADEVAGLLGLLADRYTDPDAPHGFCGSFIIGRDVNLPAAEDGASMTPAEYVAAYARLCRMANAALTSVYSHGQIYVAPSNNLSLVPEGYDTASQSLNDFLAAFNSQTRRGGDYRWGVAASAYAYSRDDSSIWDDALANGASSQLISPANIQVLTSLMVKNFSFNGERRPLIVGAFSAPDTDTAAAQATSLAYAYYKVMNVGGIDALIWGAQTDSADGVYARHGLSRADLSGNILERKQVWEVMSVIDTDCAGRLGALILGIGQGGVVDYIYGIESERAQTKVFITGAGSAIDTHEGLKVSSLFDFTRGERGGFELSGLGYEAKPALVAHGQGSALSLTPGAALVNYKIPRASLSGQHRLLVSLGQCPGGGRMALTLSQGDGRRYTAETRVERGTSEVAFEIKAFCSGLKKSDVALSLTFYPDGGEGIYSVTSLSVAKDTTASAVVWIIIFVVAVVIAVTVVLLVFTGGFHAIRRRISASRRARGERGGHGGNVERVERNEHGSGNR